MKKFLQNTQILLVLFVFSTILLNAQIGFPPTLSIIGDAVANQNDVKTYGAFTGTTTINAATWKVRGGVIQSQTTTSVNILWSVIGTGIITYNVTSSSSGAMQANKFVTVIGGTAPDHPGDPTILPPYSCTSALLGKIGNISNNQMWYWQGTNTNGTDMSYPATGNYLVTSSGNYKIRAYDTNTLVWSVLSGSVLVTLGTLGGQAWYADFDNDGLGDINDILIQCTQPSNYVGNSDDQCSGTNGQGSSNGCLNNPSLSNENYIYTVIAQKETTSIENLLAIDRDNTIENVTYFDGLGRQKQTINIRQGLENKDIVTHVEYDEFGRQLKEYLPYASTQSNGYIKSGSLTKTQTFYYKPKYQNTLNPYSEKIIENSPLAIIYEQAAPGNDWAKGNNILTEGYSDGHTIKFEYKSNIATEVKLFEVSLSFENKTYTPTLVGGASYYSEGELMKTITKDENWKTSDGLKRTKDEFKDKTGKVVLKRTYNDTSQKIDTYYIYDDFGNLTYVLSPKMKASVNNWATINSLMNDLGYQYKYDQRNRLIEKRIPGKGWEYIVYDKLDRPVLTQDAVLKPQKKWLFTKYDKLNRVVYTGIYAHGSNVDRISMQNTFNSQNNTPSEFYETKLASGLGNDPFNIDYTNTNFPMTNVDVHTVNYFGTYDFNRAGSGTPNAIGLVYGKSLTNNVKGLPTGSKVRVLETSDWITTVSYYDEKAQPIYLYSHNSYLTTTDIIKTNLDFIGK